MNDRDIIELYEKGFSIDTIIKRFYKSKNKEDRKIAQVGNIYVIRKSYFTKDRCAGIVYSILLK